LASIEAAEKKAEIGSGSFFGAEKMNLPLFSWHSFRRIVARSGPGRRRPTPFDKA
jgi:hypothetical protein